MFVLNSRFMQENDGGKKYAHKIQMISQEAKHQSVKIQEMRFEYPNIF